MRRLLRTPCPVLAVAWLLLAGCRGPTGEPVAANQPFEAQLNQFRPFSPQATRKVDSKPDAIRVVYCALSLKGSTHLLGYGSRWQEALRTAFSKALPQEWVQETQAPRRMAESLYAMGYIDRAGVQVAPEIRPPDRDRLVALFAELIQEPVPRDLLPEGGSAK